MRASSSGCLARRKPRGGRGTGAVKATGSYEGSLTAEGTPAHHEPSPFTGGWSRWARRFGRFSDLASESKRGNVRGAKAPRRESSSGSRQGCQRHDRIAGTVGRKRPRSRTSETRARGRKCPVTTRRSGSEVVKPRNPWSVARRPKAAGRPRSESCGASQERTRYECTQVVRVADVGCTHRASSPLSDRKVRW